VDDDRHGDQGVGRRFIASTTLNAKRPKIRTARSRSNQSRALDRRAPLRKRILQPRSDDPLRPRTPDDWLERNVYSRFSILGITIMGAVNVILFGVVPGALILVTQIAWIPFWAAASSTASPLLGIS